MDREQTGAAWATIEAEVEGSASMRWTADVMTDENRAWLRQLPVYAARHHCRALHVPLPRLPDPPGRVPVVGAALARLLPHRERRGRRSLLLRAHPRGVAPRRRPGALRGGGLGRLRHRRRRAGTVCGDLLRRARHRGRLPGGRLRPRRRRARHGRRRVVPSISCASRPPSTRTLLRCPSRPRRVARSLGRSPRPDPPAHGSVAARSLVRTDSSQKTRSIDVRRIRSASSLVRPTALSSSSSSLASRLPGRGRIVVTHDHVTAGGNERSHRVALVGRRRAGQDVRGGADLEADALAGGPGQQRRVLRRRGSMADAPDAEQRRARPAPPRRGPASAACAVRPRPAAAAMANGSRIGPGRGRGARRRRRRTRRRRVPRRRPRLARPRRWSSSSW